MPRTLITPETISDVGADTAPLLTFVAADVVNGNRFPYTPDSVLIAWNAHAADAISLTVTGIADTDTGRSANLVTSIEAQDHHRFGPVQASGWKQVDGMIYISSPSASLFFAVIKVRA